MNITISEDKDFLDKVGWILNDDVEPGRTEANYDNLKLKYNL